MKKKDWLVLISISLVLAACGVFGVSYVAGEGWPILKLWAELLLTVLFAILFMIIFILLDCASEIALGKSKRKFTTVFLRLSPSWSVKSVFIFSGIMALLWLPWYIANFPGGTYWDTYYQMFQVYPENHPIAVIPWEEIYNQTLTDAWLVDHHPVFTTLVYGAFALASDFLTGNWMLGVAVFCALQGVAHIVAFTTSVAYLKKSGCPPLLCFIAYVYFALMPFISTWAMCMVKDSFFGLFFVCYFMMLFACVQTQGQTFSKRSNRVWFVLLALGLCLTKKTGIYVVVFTAIVGVVVYLKRSKKAALLSFVEQGAACLLVMCLVLPCWVFPSLNIEAGGKQEVLGPLFQQTARYVHDYGDEVTSEERQAIDAVLPYEKLADEYAYDFEDSVKYRYNLNATDEDLKEYLKVYVSQGLKHPDSYFAAIVSLAGFYVAPASFINIRMVTVDTKMGDDQRYMLWNPDELEPFRTALDNTYETIGKTPVLNLPLLNVLYLLWIPAFLVYMLFRRKNKLSQNAINPNVLFAPLLVLLAFCIIAPVFDSRYAVPSLDVAPLLLCAVVTCIIKSTSSVTNYNIVKDIASNAGTESSDGHNYTIQYE